MLRLQKCILTQLLPSTSAYAISPLHRLFSAAAPAVSPNPSFAVEEYLVATCGLTPAQARKASPKLSHLKSPANPDAVLAFLAGIGLSGADVAALVAKDPQFLCAKVDKTLAPVITGLTGLGLSRSDIARLVSLDCVKSRCRSVVYKVEYHLHLLGSFDNLLRLLKRNSYLLGSDLERVVKPNVAVLQECGLGACDIVKLCTSVPWMLTTTLERIQAMVACAQGLGVPCGSAMFRHALNAIAFLSEEKMAAKVEYLRKAFRWSDAQAGIAVSKLPMILAWSNDVMQNKAEFLISEVGLEPGTGTTMLQSHGPRRYSWTSTFALTWRLRRTSLKTMQQLAEGKCRLESDLHEPSITSMPMTCWFGRCYLLSLDEAGNLFHETWYVHVIIQ